MISVAHYDDGRLKDTGLNIIANHEFVVNMVTEELMPVMNISAADFPGNESELHTSGLHEAASTNLRSRAQRMRNGRVNRTDRPAIKSPVIAGLFIAAEVPQRLPLSTDDLCHHPGAAGAPCSRNYRRCVAAHAHFVCACGQYGKHIGRGEPDRIMVGHQAGHVTTECVRI